MLRIRFSVYLPNLRMNEWYVRLSLMKISSERRNDLFVREKKWFVRNIVFIQIIIWTLKYVDNTRFKFNIYFDNLLRKTKISYAIMFEFYLMAPLTFVIYIKWIYFWSILKRWTINDFSSDDSIRATFLITSFDFGNWNYCSNIF